MPLQRREEAPYPSGLYHRAKQHWQQYRPKMYQALQQSGQLHQALLDAQEWTLQTLAQQEQQGVPSLHARELVLPMWVLLPSEEDVPVLGELPLDPLHPPDPATITT